MARMGHDSPRAALIYQHRTSEADQAIAQAVNQQLEAEQRAAEEKRRDAGEGAQGSPPRCTPRARGGMTVAETLKALTRTAVLSRPFGAERVKVWWFRT